MSKENNEIKLTSFSGYHDIEKILVSVVKAEERTVRQASDFCTSVGKVKKLIEIKNVVSDKPLVTLVYLLNEFSIFSPCLRLE